MTQQRCDQRSAFHIPYADTLIPSSACQQLAIRAKAYSTHPGCVSLKREHRLARFKVPQRDRVMIIPTGEQFPIWTERDRTDPTSMTVENMGCFPCRNIPEPD